MKKIFESDYNGWYESATKMHVYALDDDEEYFMLDAMNGKELCDHFGVSNDYWAAPGAIYYEYDFHLQGNHIIMYETKAVNV